ncbi:MAG: hypothetical protein WBA57_14410 [Elainellaceae cyanobacterium]
MLEAFLMALIWCIHRIQPLIVPICFAIAWLFVGSFAWGIFSFLRDGTSRAKQMHQIPCSNCRYFTADYHLKCPVHPSKALSELAINCLDYEEHSIYWS